LPDEFNLGKLFSSSLEEVLGGEDLLLEVARDLVKDEIKKKVLKALEENPELKQELKAALDEYYQAKLTQTLAAMKIAKASVRLGLRTAPEELQKDVQVELEKEITRIIDDTL
jgi:hypothetical protein